MASRSWNRAELIGNLTRDPELRFTPTGAAVCTFSVATNRTYVSSEGERKEEVDFHRCVSWNKLAELCNQLLKKGHRVFISGRLQNRTWESQDGQQRNVTEIVVEDMILLTPRTNGDMISPGEDVKLEVEETRQVSPSSLATVRTEDKVDSKTEKVVKDKESLEKKESKEEKPKAASKSDKSADLPSEDVSLDEDLPF